MAEDFEPIDKQMFGATLRIARMRAGYRRAEDFIESVYRRTRVRIARSVIYKIERGEQMPSLIQYMAMSITLKGVLFDKKPISNSLSEEWELILSAGDGESRIPAEWAVENFEAIDDGSGKSIEELATEHNEPAHWLFANDKK